MPSASHPQAQFVPISPDFDLHALVNNTSNFDYVTRLSTKKLKEHSIQSFEALVLAVVIQSGKPLVIEDWGQNLPPWLFSPAWLQENLGTKPEQVRDIPNEANIPMTIGHYLRSMETLTNRITSVTYRDPKRQRLYMKDIDCPDTWFTHLKEVMPEFVFYLNECIEPRTGGDGAIREPNEYGQMVYGKGVAPAGDLMSSLPPEMRAMNMMCYIGHEGTYTPAHREMCASLGHNVMVEASENRKGEKAGSSVWFMTETKEREVVSEYFLSMLGHDIEVEKHFAQVNAWKKAPFNVWVVEQRVGDLILIPPLAPHQVWNRGTRTMKAAWNRTTVDTLELALHEALPRARMVCREEQYKNKAIVYYTLVKYYDLLQRDTVEPKMWKYGRIKQVLEDFKRLFALYGEILVSEMFSPKLPEEQNVEYLQFDSNVTCSYCRGNIFNRFLTCKSCIQHGPNEEEDTYDICMDCYAMGRSCACISNLIWVEQWPWDTLVQNYDLWRATVIQFDEFFDKYRSPQPLDIARKQYGRKPVAEVCQEQLRLRPWNDITKEQEPTLLSEEEPEVDDEGRIKKKRKNARSKGKKHVQVKNKTSACHICCWHDWNWKLAFCTTCNLAYCYGTLWRAFDLMPQTVMEDKEWSCPRCLKICSCGKCRKDPRQKAYAPKGTLLGHDTKKVADYRSVESLVDFSKTNLAWLRSENEKDPHESSRMKKLKEKAEAEKARVDTVNDGYLDGATSSAFGVNNGQSNPKADADQDIDPLLLGNGQSSASNERLNRNNQNQFGSMNGTTVGDDPMTAHGTDPSLTFGCMNDDFHYEFDEFDPSNSHTRQQANYPAGLLAPTAPDEIYPDPTHVDQNRMMGVGFYQQGSGIDRILFNAPDEIGSGDETQRQSRPTKNPNLLFSDLLDPPLQQPDETKKRKRMGQDGIEEEEEFFTSKRQKKLAKEKQLLQEYGLDDDMAHKRRPSQRQPPRRSTGKASYKDLGEEAVSIEDDEGPSNVPKRKVQNPAPDMGLAADASSRLTKPTPKPRSGKRPGRPKRGELTEGSGQNGTPAQNTIKTPRRSAWLARKEAADNDKEITSELSNRTRRPRSAVHNAKAASPAINISSSSEDGDNSNINIEEEISSLFGEPIDRGGSEGGGAGLEPSTNSDMEVSKSSIAEVEIEPVAKPILEAVEEPLSTLDVPPPKRGRGRPPKTSKSVERVREVAAAPATTMLTLKERLAFKGKAVKIVASKSRETVGTSSGPSSAKATPSVPSKAILKSGSAASPVPSPAPAWGKFRIQEEVDDGPAASSPAKLSRLTETVSLPVETSVAKGPTVVRLLSPTPELEEANGLARTYSSSHDEEDSESGASIPAVQISPNSARLGRFAVRG